MAEVVENLVELGGDLLVYRARYAHAPWLGQLLYPCRQIDAVTVNIVPVPYYFAEVNANPELQALIFGQLRISRRHLTLEFDGRVNR